MQFSNQLLAVLRRKRANRRAAAVEFRMLAPGAMATARRGHASDRNQCKHAHAEPWVWHPQNCRHLSLIIHRSSFSAAFTLVELLVVIAIIVTVSAIIVPLLTPVLDSRRIRESGRIVSTQFASAQSEAMAKGRPVGVWIERLGANSTSPNTDRSAAMEMYLCEVPQPYSGDSIDSRVVVQEDASPTGAPAPRYFVTFSSSDSSWLGLPIRPGDLIRFNYRGPWYTITGDTAEYQNQLLQTDQMVPIKNTIQKDAQGNQSITAAPNMHLAIDRIRTSPTVPDPSQTWAKAASNYLDCQMPATDVPMPYQILRQPVKTSTQPVELPSGSVIDLYASGTTSTFPYFGGITGFATDKSPVIVTFGANGALDSFYLMGRKYPLTEPVYFLLGQREKLPHVTYTQTDPPETQAEKHNFRDLENLWVSINPQTGLITTSEMAQLPNESSLTGANENALLIQAIPQSRQYATSAQNMGGR